MLRCILLLLLGLPLLAWMPAGQARTLQARIERVDSPVAVLHEVRVRLEWPEQAPRGRLRIVAARAVAPDLGYAFEDLAWECPLERPADPRGNWSCEGEVRSDGAPPMRLAVDLGPASTSAELVQDEARLALARLAAAPDHTRIELTRVPLAWAQALVAQAWESGQLGAGSLDGVVRINSAAGRLGLDANLALEGGAFETVDASAAGEGLDASVRVGFRNPGGRSLVTVDGELGGGALLFDNAFIDLPDEAVPLQVDAVRTGPSAGWRLARFAWEDAPALAARGSAVFAPDASLQELDVELASNDASLLPARYLSGWLALAGLRELRMRGGLDARVAIRGGEVRDGRLRLRELDLLGHGERFTFDALDGEVSLASAEAVDSELRWRGGAVGGLRFGSARLPLRSRAGELRLREPVELDMLGGRVGFDALSLRLPAGGQGLRAEFGMAVEDVEVEQLAQSFGWPAFGGSLSGQIPAARYQDERLVFDGGLSVQVFDGRIDVGSLSMDRPFGVAPTLSADLEMHELDLYAITEVFDFGDISGRLSGSLDGLRLVDWRLSSFDAELGTVPRAGVRQRISQRAVQNISSVGGGGFIGGLQGQLIGFFDDFGYSRIGISCRLRNEVCRMGGLRSSGNAFTIVEGAGIPHLRVIGHNRNVDWPTLVERVGAAIGGDVAPVVD
ncbi:MAG: hypothetical protein ACTHXB_06975 [Luteimonas sp.]